MGIIQKEGMEMTEGLWVMTYTVQYTKALGGKAREILSVLLLDKGK